MNTRFIVATLTLVLASAVSAGAQPAKPKTKAAAQAKPSVAPVPEGMTNADVIKMIQAGLGEALVIGAIRQAPQHAFTLTPDGLVALKAAGIPDSVMQVMLNPTASPSVAPVNAPVVTARVDTPPPGPGPAAADSAAPAIVAAEAGVYYVAGSGAIRMEAKSPYQTRTGSKMVSRLSFGIKPARMNTMLQGLRSDLQVTNSPQFYVHLDQVLGNSESIGEYYLVRFTPKEAQGRREIEIASSGLGKSQLGFPEKDLFQLDATRVQKDVYLVSPKSALPEGEFGLVQVPQGPAPTPRRIYDFGVR